jgi:hypothetical protein
MVNLIIGHKLDSGIWENTNQGRRMALQQSQDPGLLVNNCSGAENTTPTARILLEIRIRRLKENLDSIQRGNRSLGLFQNSRRLV